MTSTNDIGYNESKAIKLNARFAKSIGWHGKIDPLAVADFPGLARDPLGSHESQVIFAFAVYELQMLIFNGDEEDADGILGRGTLGKIDEHYHPIDLSKRFYVHDGERVEAPEHDNICAVVTFLDAGGYDLNSSGKYERKGEPTHMFLHWSATTKISSCYNALSNRNLSTHFGVGLTPDGDPIIHQWLDTVDDGVHSGVGKKTKARGGISGNKNTISMDICSTPKLSAKKSLIKRHHRVREIENHSARGERRVLTLDPRIARATFELARDMCHIHSIPFVSPISATEMGPVIDNFHGLVTKDFYHSNPGVYTHTNTHPDKWDVFEPWWRQIFGGSHAST